MYIQLIWMKSYSDWRDRIIAKIHKIIFRPDLVDLLESIG